MVTANAAHSCSQSITRTVLQLFFVFFSQCTIADEPAPIVSGFPVCEECKKDFKDSYLLQKFDYSVCDSCRWVLFLLCIGMIFLLSCFTRISIIVCNTDEKCYYYNSNSKAYPYVEAVCVTVHSKPSLVQSVSAEQKSVKSDISMADIGMRLRMQFSHSLAQRTDCLKIDHGMPRCSLAYLIIECNALHRVVYRINSCIVLFQGQQG